MPVAGFYYFLPEEGGWLERTRARFFRNSPVERCLGKCRANAVYPAYLRHLSHCKVALRAKRREVLQRYEKRGVSPKFARMIHDGEYKIYQAMRGVKKYLSTSFDTNAPLLIAGPKGSGKGFAGAFLLARYGGFRVEIEKNTDLLHNEERPFETLVTAPLLLLDGFRGPSSLSAETLEALLLLLKKRAHRSLVTVITTPLSREEREEWKNFHQLDRFLKEAHVIAVSDTIPQGES